jgi:hypothetical protein
MPRIYLSYRRAESAAAAQRLLATFERLGIICTESSRSERFNTNTEREIKGCDFVLVLMGTKWATLENRFGFSLLYDPNDVVRREVETALTAKRTIIPILVDGAAIPESGNIPVSLAPLLTLKPIVLRNDPYFDDDLQPLLEKIHPNAVQQRNIAAAAHHIFISYSRKDVPIMQRLRDDLRGSQFSVWVDEDGLEPGTSDWESAVSKAIRGTACLIVLLSPDAEQSTWVGRELAMAEMLDKRIFPILVRGSEKDAIPIRLMSHQWVDARHNYGEALEKVLAAVKRYLII